MGLENIKNLNELNQLLNNTAAVLKNTKAEDHNKVITVSSWGSRDYTLIPSGGNDPIHAKMSEIVSTFERLANKQEDKDNHLIGNIHDKIFELNDAGEKKLLNEKGRAAVLLRDIKTLSFITEFFFGSHSTKNDSIELEYLSTETIQDKANKILEEFDEFNNTIDKLTKNKDQPIQKTPDRVRQLLETDDYINDIPDDEGYVPNDGIHIAIDSKIEYSKEILRNIFTESKAPNPESSENTKNAIRYIVLNNPEEALDIIESLKSHLNGMSQHPVNPQEFIQSIQHFLDVQEEEIYSTTKKPRPNEESGTSQVVVNMQPADPDNPIKNIKTQFGENFSIILDEKTKTPMLQFKFASADERKAKNDLVESAIIAASEFSIYEKPEDDILPLFSALNEEYTLNVPPHSSLLLSGVSREVFMEKMYQAMWEQSSTPEEHSKVLEGVIANLPETEVEDFLALNDVDLDSDYLVKNSPAYNKLNESFPELLKYLELQNGIKNFSIADSPSAPTMLVEDYINDKSKTVPIEEKLLLFIQHANPEAMNLLLDHINTLSSKTNVLNTPIKTGPHSSATPLKIALRGNKKEIIQALYNAGATESIFLDDSPKTNKNSPPADKGSPKTIKDSQATNKDTPEIIDFSEENSVQLSNEYPIETTKDLYETTEDPGVALQEKFEPTIQKEPELKLQKETNLEFQNRIQAKNIDLPERKELQDEIKTFRIQKNKFDYDINEKLYTQSQVVNYFNDKYKDIPIEEKLLLFIRYANSDAMNLLLSSIRKNKNIDLDKPIKIDSHFTMTPLAFAMKEGKSAMFYDLRGAGAKVSVIIEDSKERRFSTEKYINDKEMIEINPEEDQ